MTEAIYTNHAHDRAAPPNRMPVVSLAAAILGFPLSVWNYESLAPALVFLLLYLVGLIVLLPSRKRIKTSFTLFYSVFWAASGVSAIYADALYDYAQTVGDASHFYQLSIQGIQDLEYLSRRTEGSLAVAVWSHIYNTFSSLGFEANRYIGIAFNSLIMAMTGVIGCRIVSLAYRDDYRERLFSWLFPFSGLFWLFASIHVRDAFATFAVALLALLWVKFLGKRSTLSLLVLIVVSVIAPVPLSYIRTEYLYLPAVFATAGMAAIVLEYGPTTRQRLNRILSLVILVPAGAIISVLYLSDAALVLTSGRDAYSGFVQNSAAAESLGMKLIVNAPAPIRAVLGPIYLLVFPIPVWSGVVNGTAYHLFKSANAVFMYFWLPALAIATLRFYRYGELRTAAPWFFLIVFWGMTLSVAMSSLENRHFGSFLVLGLAFSLVPDYRLPRERIAYVNLRNLSLAGAVMIHLAWAIIK